MTRHSNSIPHLNVKHDYFKNSFFLSTMIQWYNLDSNIRNSESLALFKKRILAFIRPSSSSTFLFQVLQSGVIWDTLIRTQQTNFPTNPMESSGTL